MQIVASTGQLIGDHARNGISQIEDIKSEFFAIADQHGHRHRLAEGAAQSEKTAADDAGTRIRENYRPNHLPARRAESQRSLPLGGGHRSANVVSDGGDI